MGRTRDFQSAVPAPAQEQGSLRYNARELRDFIEKNTPPSPENSNCKIRGTWNRPGRGPNGESST